MQFEEDGRKDLESNTQTFLLRANKDKISFLAYDNDTAIGADEKGKRDNREQGNRFLRKGFSDAIKYADESIITPMYIGMDGKSVEGLSKDKALNMIYESELSIAGFKFNPEATEEQKKQAFRTVMESFVNTSNNLDYSDNKTTRSLFWIQNNFERSHEAIYSAEGKEDIPIHRIEFKTGLISEDEFNEFESMHKKREDILKALLVTQDGKEEDKNSTNVMSNDISWLDRYFQSISDLSSDKKGSLYGLSKNSNTLDGSLGGEKKFQFVAENKCVVSTSPEEAKAEDFKAIIELAKKEGKNIRLGSEMTDDFRFALVQACAQEGVRISNLPEDCKGLYEFISKQNQAREGNEPSVKRDIKTFDIDKDKLPKVELVPDKLQAMTIDLNDYADKINTLQPGETLTFGRDPSNDKAKENIKIPEANASVSRNHFSIFCDGQGKLHLQDTSSYGTKVSETNDTVSRIQELRGLASGRSGARKNPAVQQLQAEKLIYKPGGRD